MGGPELIPTPIVYDIVYDIEELEHACADAWPAQVERRLGQWRLRAAADPAPGGDGRGGTAFTGRANSTVAVGDPGTTPEVALARACEFAHDHGIKPMALAVRGGPVEPALAAAGWRPYEEYPAGNEVSVLLAPVPPHSPVPPEEPTEVPVRVLDAPTAGWWELVAGRAEPTPAQRHVLTGVAAVAHAVAECDGGRGARRPDREPAARGPPCRATGVP